MFVPSIQYILVVIALVVVEIAAGIVGFIFRDNVVSFALPCMLCMCDSAQPAELPQLVEPSLEHRVLCLALYE